MLDVQIALDDAMLVECPRCGTVSIVPYAHDVTNEIADVAALVGALDVFREIDCSECGAVVKVRPSTPERLGGGDDA